MTSPLVARAQLPAALQATLMFKILAYDHALPARAGSVVRIAVVYRDGPSGAAGSASELASALSELASHSKLLNRSVEVVAVPFSRIEAARGQLSDAAAIYLCAGLDADVATITRFTTQSSIITFTGTEEFLSRGAAVGLVRRGDRPAIVLHAQNARASGADFDAGLIRVAEVIR